MKEKSELQKLLHYASPKNGKLKEEDIVMIGEWICDVGIDSCIGYIENDIKEDDCYAHLRGEDVYDLLDEYYYQSVLDGDAKEIFFQG